MQSSDCIICCPAAINKVEKKERYFIEKEVIRSGLTFLHHPTGPVMGKPSCLFAGSGSVSKKSKVIRRITTILLLQQVCAWAKCFFFRIKRNASLVVWSTYFFCLFVFYIDNGALYSDCSVMFIFIFVSCC